MKYLSILLALFLYVGCASEKKENEKPAVVKVSLKIDGMVCTSCENSIKTKIAKVEGVKSVEVSQETGNAEVMFDASKVNTEKIIADIGALGYKASAKSAQ